MKFSKKIFVLAAFYAISTSVFAQKVNGNIFFGKKMINIKSEKPKGLGLF